MEEQYLNDFHRKHSEDLGKEIEHMRQHPLSLEEVKAQVCRIHEASQRNASKEMQHHQPLFAQQAVVLRSKAQDLQTPHQPLKFILIDEAVKSSIWTDAALQELNNLIVDINNERTIFKRFPSQAQRGFTQGGRANAAASIILRGSQGTSAQDSRSITEKRLERDAAQTETQQQIVENWAKVTGYWFDNP